MMGDLINSLNFPMGILVLVATGLSYLAWRGTQLIPKIIYAGIALTCLGIFIAVLVLKWAAR